ncbi:Tetratricopeptide-like helical [Penicillium italicum]|uniref:Tetratricopeptide-like helical n=1 Tax=Penicillium italicum TaxID=40296 RepID=A0A0A2L0I8_PENIT|nr:Tetratricopeptide-like helical [Penicillium italicum]
MAGEDRLGITVLHDPTVHCLVGEKGLPLGDVVFDLVAIHGLNGDAIDTWPHKETKVMWLEDLLPEAIPNIRIMTYGYNARFKSFTAQQDLRSISYKLLAELVDLRATPEERRNWENDVTSIKPASTLLAASRFSDAQWKTKAISRAKQLLEQVDEPYLKRWLAYRESAILRMSGMLQKSETVLHESLYHVTIPSREGFEISPRFNAQLGELIISFSENLIRQGKLLEAKAELVEWKALKKDYSTLESISARARDITLGKVLRFQGHFREALALLESVLEGCQLDDYFEGSGWYRVLLSEVADLYCELDRPDDAERLLIRELTPMMEKETQDIATGRRLRMSLAETYLQRDMYAEAESLLKNLQQAFSSSGAPDYSAKFNIFRIWVSLARASHKQSQWEEALSSLEHLKLGGGFDAGLVRCSTSHALMMTGHEYESKRSFQKAEENMASESRVFWIALFNSQWHDFVIDALKKIHVN